MLNDSPSNLREEALSAITLRKKVTDLSAERIASEHGSDYLEGMEPDVEPHENHYHDFRSVILPKIAYYNPKVSFSSRRPVVQRMLAKAMDLGTNRWIRDVNLIKTLRLVGLDMLFDFGVILTALENAPGQEGRENPGKRPSAVRISPRRYFCDPQANGYAARRYEGHLIVKDADDMKRERSKGRAVYNPKVIDAMTGNGGEMDRTFGGMSLKSLGIEAVDRNQVVYFEMYVPESKKIYTLGFDGDRWGEKDEYLREPRKAFCPPWGPYSMFGVYAVPDQIYPLAPLAIPQTLMEEINAHIDQNSRLADQAGTFHVVNSPNQKLNNVVKRARPGEIVFLPGFDQSQLAEVNRPGPSAEAMLYVDRLRDRLDRKSGLTDFQRGEVTGKATAFEVGKAATAGDVRTRFIQQQFGECARGVVETAAWYLAHAYSVSFPLPMPIEAPGEEEGSAGAAPYGGAIWNPEEMEDGHFYGGLQEGQEDFDWFDLELTLDPKSMELEDDFVQTQQWMTFADWLTKTAPVMASTPYVNWPEMLEMTGDRFNVPDAAGLINFPMLSAMIGAQGVAFQQGEARKDPREIMARNAPPPAAGAGATGGGA